ncbi:oligopeptide transport ATP-binding protein OppF [Paraliobacillus ryukyuensis]|uniref:Oligopeptide transport system ATP-binding protein n=1 Tax=Paraliobacillus ryukyuensis TaxID=200904 RepID=A0A366EE21_9BACI|nr:dipeptide ABC transporter ATP-binding protein [Paraliobacillus ryukyuensis]RBP00637.1 oligopeptide transport system ATP-binding protein [Paraliobacillus ryukyuensis]
MTETILEVTNLKKYFNHKHVVKAVDGVSFTLKKGETLGIVGESGCGKSTTGRMLMRLIDATEGSIVFQGKNLVDLSIKQMRAMRKDVQMIFQDPYASLNPRHTIERIIEEPMIVHKMGNKIERKERVRELLEIVGLSSDYAKRYPHQFSGGQRQRIGIARALAVRPKLIIADEPVSALDVSVQAQVLNLLDDLQKKFELTYLFIAHDLSVVRHISNRVAVMYLGRIVELANRDDLYDHPKHPYTKALLSSVPIPAPDFEKEETELKGDIPSPSNPPTGCPFHTRCPLVMEKCKTKVPQARQNSNGHYVVCHLYNDKEDMAI